MPYRDNIETNPYSPPQSAEAAPVIAADMDRVKRLVRGPGISLIVLSTVAMLLDIVIITNAIRRDAPLMLEEYGRNGGMVMIAANVGGNSLLMLVHLIVLIGAFKMLRVQTYPNALTSAIVSIVPFCSPIAIVGIPFGIWALVTLTQPEVKAAFRANAA